MINSAVIFLNNSGKGLQTENEFRQVITHIFFMLLALTVHRNQNLIENFSLFPTNSSIIPFPVYDM